MQMSALPIHARTMEFAPTVLVATYAPAQTVGKDKIVIKVINFVKEQRWKGSCVRLAKSKASLKKKRFEKYQNYEDYQKGSGKTSENSYSKDIVIYKLILLLIINFLIHLYSPIIN